ncbi:unnamed protein product [Didymodactylos carnosus]|uniref:Uncharacterized protein n=1 Tax=Didymodactylos carnosus TaxID=1234261 RepID=A0A813T3P1_9BILA|nr:unnamed protein product [Didymodactylos carnosus]CAF0809133.1 unnamed protein product [Didymodactylos carnosus]CAF3535982.1 unnamed protein product [Didymodactylos carnosus]CAF3594691.1 unnamed protein product [Didymodactylos carnosus]
MTDVNFRNYDQDCDRPDAVAGRLAALRNIHVREEICNVARALQAKYKERLPVLYLVATVSYEQVWKRQPLSPNDKIHRDAVGYGLMYYEQNMYRLAQAEALSGLYPPHDAVNCCDQTCPIHHEQPWQKEEKDLPLSLISNVKSDLVNQTKRWDESLFRTSNERSIQDTIIRSTEMNTVQVQELKDTISATFLTAVSNDVASVDSKNAALSTFSGSDISQPQPPLGSIPMQSRIIKSLVDAIIDGQKGEEHAAKKSVVPKIKIVRPNEADSPGYDITLESQVIPTGKDVDVTILQQKSADVQSSKESLLSKGSNKEKGMKKNLKPERQGMVVYNYYGQYERS